MDRWSQVVPQFLSIARTDDSENIKLSSQFNLCEFKRIGNITRLSLSKHDSTNDSFKGLTGTIAVNEFVANVIEWFKNMSPTRKEQKGKY